MTTALSPLPDLLALPPARAEAIRSLAPHLRPGLRVAREGRDDRSLTERRGFGEAVDDGIRVRAQT